jgi:transposase InsO family protein
MFHSDQGSQFTSTKFKKPLRKHKVEQSLSNAGTPYDNAVVESFFASLKRDEIYQNIYDDINNLNPAVEEYINFFNNERPHQRLCFKTPRQVEDGYFGSGVAV